MSGVSEEKEKGFLQTLGSLTDSWVVLRRLLADMVFANVQK
jgi:hypothetical protein